MRKKKNQKQQHRQIRIQLFCMQYFVNILNEIAFTQHPLKNPLINSFIRKSFYGENVLLISRTLIQFEESDPVINSSMQQRRKRIPVVYCTTCIEPVLLVDGLCVISLLVFEKYL